MAIAVSNVTSGTSAVAGTSVATASISPTSNNLVLATVSTRSNVTADPPQPTATGAGLTWVVVGSIVYDSTSASRRRVTLFRALGTVSAGAVTFDWGVQTQTDFAWSIDQVSGIDTSGTNGSGAIVQSVTNKDETNTVATLTVTLAAFSGASNATYGAFGYDGGVSGTAASTAGTGFTKTAGVLSGVNVGASTEYQLANDTTVDMSWNTNLLVGGIAAELKVAPATSVNSGFFAFMR